MSAAAEDRIVVGPLAVLDVFAGAVGILRNRPLLALAGGVAAGLAVKVVPAQPS